MIDSGDIEANGFKWCNADHIGFKIKFNDPFLVNTDLRGNPGVHWITCVVIRAASGAIIYFYDPLGARNKRVDSSGNLATSVMISTIKRNIGARSAMGEAHSDAFVHFYQHPSQMADTTRCGWFALFIADLIKSIVSNERSMTDPRDLDQAIQSVFGTSADSDDEGVVAGAFGMTR